MRKGFTLLPDFASTAFMMQGYTLDGAVADCGSVLASGGLTEMMTTYVILSRVKKADGFLLTQAFAREIFRLGVAPGPHCLQFCVGCSVKEPFVPCAPQPSAMASSHALWHVWHCSHSPGLTHFSITSLPRLPSAPNLWGVLSRLQSKHK